MTPESLLRAAAVHREAGRITAAIEAYEAALRLQPGMPNSWYNLALLQRRAGRFDQALASYDQALTLGISGPEEVHLNRGVIFADDLGRSDLAEEALHAALRLDPNYVPALLNIGNLYEDLGAQEKAQAAYARAAALAPEAPMPLARLLGVSTLAGPDDTLARMAQSRMHARDISAADRADIAYALAGALDRAGAYDEAFAAATAANLARRQSGDATYDRAAQERYVDRMLSAFPCPGTAPARCDGRSPVFIVGMFRSGSTLAEHILARGRGVATGGELTIVPELIAETLRGYPEAAAAAPVEQIGHLRSLYLERLRAARGDAPFHTDKRPDNFLHIGLIKRLFPEAKFVHTVRAPADMAVSLFFLNLDPIMGYATELGDIAHWHRQYRRLMAHWESLWPDDIYRLDYDALVRDSRRTIQALFRFTGIPHDEAALDYHGSTRAVRTASAGQVHRPLYLGPSGRWRNYERHLSPFLDALREP